MTMHFTVTGRQMDVGDSLRNHIQTQVTDLVGKYFGQAIEAHAVLSREATYLYCCDLTVHAGRGILMQVSEKGTDPYLAADKAAELIAKRMRRHKRRIRNHHAGQEHKLHQEMQARSYILADLDRVVEPEHEPEVDTDDAVDPLGQPAVVAEMATAILTLSVSDAVMRLDLSDAPALMFKSSVHGGLNLVYRRKDGLIGWIDPGRDGAGGGRA